MRNALVLRWLTRAILVVMLGAAAVVGYTGSVVGVLILAPTFALVYLWIVAGR